MIWLSVYPLGVCHSFRVDFIICTKLVENFEVNHSRKRKFLFLFCSISANHWFFKFCWFSLKRDEKKILVFVFSFRLCLFAKILIETGRKCENITIFFIESYVSQLEKDLLHPIFLFLHVFTDKCKCRISFSNSET